MPRRWGASGGFQSQKTRRHSASFREAAVTVAADSTVAIETKDSLEQRSGQDDEVKQKKREGERGKELRSKNNMPQKL